jgi:uncharacterized protein (DUF58 family)
VEGRAAVLDPELLERLASLTVAARRAVAGARSGMHRSPHRGASVVFVEHREYRAGDDIRALDWRAFAPTSAKRCCAPPRATSPKSRPR